MKKILFCICLFISGFQAFCQSSGSDTTLPNFFLHRIRELQASQHADILPGLFYSYISSNETFSTKRTDENIFYNGLISYTLRDISPKLTDQNRELVDSILQNAIPAFDKFKNTKGRNTYNFWRTDTSFEFPYTWWIKLLRGQVTLPDDMDDTSLGLLALQASPSISSEVHSLMAKFINDSLHDLRNGLSYFKNYAAYSTWFGKNFPVVIDACVLTNILSFVQLNDLPWNSADSASLQLILRIIDTKDYIKNPLQVSPYYGKPSIFLYNLARLMSIKQISALESRKMDLITEAALELAHSSNMMEQILLSSAILKWGYIPPPIETLSPNVIKKIIEENNFAFFIGNIPSYLPSTLRKIIMHKNDGLFYHYCPAYNLTLLLEYVTLSEDATK
ncbi:MAG: hypothetical protein JSS67_01920 [Bacteroidetes bacterium]|nr:hypothetical protein [Bacteroidota bacterium]